MTRKTATATLLIAMSMCGANHADEPRPTTDKVTTAARRIKAADPRIKMQAIAELAPLAADSPLAATALCEAVVFPSRSVSMAAFEAVEKARPDLYKPISSLMLDTEPAKRAQAIRDLVALGSKASPTLPILQAVFLVELKQGPDPTTRELTPLQKTALAAIRKLGPDDPETVKLLKSLVASDHRFTAARKEALAALTEWAGNDGSRRKEISPAIKSGMSDPGCLPQCIEALGNLGPEARDALPTLKKLKLSSDANIRSLATSAVAKIDKP